MTKKFAKFRHIDTSGLPKGFDIADLVDSGVTGDALMAWLRDRVRDGPPGPHMLSQPEPKQRKPAKPKPTAQAAPQGSVAAMRQLQPAARRTRLAIPRIPEDALAEAFTGYRDVGTASLSTWLHWEDNLKRMKLSSRWISRGRLAGHMNEERTIELGTSARHRGTPLEGHHEEHELLAMRSPPVGVPQQFDADPCCSIHRMAS
jgi:hypothetical protein